MKQRVITALIGGAVFLALLLLGGTWFAAFISLLAFIGFYEFSRMSKLHRSWFALTLGFLLVGAFVSPTIFDDFTFIMDYFTEIVVGIVFFMLYFTVQSKNTFTLENLGTLLVGVIYIGFGFYFFIQTRLDYDVTMILFVLIIIWTTDTAAYMIGRKWGRTKLWPTISPNKTIEGSGGAIIVAVVAGVLFQHFTNLLDSWTHLLLLTAFISVAGQIGDLVESGMKRYYNVKDSGTLLPGHGGILDRFDSILFVFPLLHLLHLI